MLDAAQSIGRGYRTVVHLDLYGGDAMALADADISKHLETLIPAGEPVTYATILPGMIMDSKAGFFRNLFGSIDDGKLGIALSQHRLAILSTTRLQRPQFFDSAHLIFPIEDIVSVVLRDLPGLYASLTIETRQGAAMLQLLGSRSFESRRLLSAIESAIDAVRND